VRVAIREGEPLASGVLSLKQSRAAFIPLDLYVQAGSAADPLALADPRPSSERGDDGSSPPEGFEKSPVNRLTRRRPGFGVVDAVRDTD
jgi:hypothetical protein